MQNERRGNRTRASFPVRLLRPALLSPSPPPTVAMGGKWEREGHGQGTPEFHSRRGGSLPSNAGPSWRRIATDSSRTAGAAVSPWGTPWRVPAPSCLADSLTNCSVVCEHRIWLQGFSLNKCRHRDSNPGSAVSRDGAFPCLLTLFGEKNKVVKGQGRHKSAGCQPPGRWSGLLQGPDSPEPAGLGSPRGGPRLLHEGAATEGWVRPSARGS